jgi:hypothetical protein
MVASTNGLLTLHFLPGYAPELNPDELVRTHMKRTGVARTPLRKGEQLSDKIECRLYCRLVSKNAVLHHWKGCSPTFAIFRRLTSIAPRLAGEPSRCIAGAVAPGDVVGRTRNHARSVGG